jgi:hypothetical protein
MSEAAVDRLFKEAIACDRAFVRSFQSTNKKARYYKLLDELHKQLAQFDNVERAWLEYMSKPRILVQGCKTIDLRVDTPGFKAALFEWLRTYPNDFVQPASTGDMTGGTPGSTPAKLGIPGVSRKQLSQMIKHKERVPAAQRKVIQEMLNSMPESDDILISKLKDAFCDN